MMPRGCRGVTDSPSCRAQSPIRDSARPERCGDAVDRLRCHIRGCSSTARTSAFQADDAGSIPVVRSTRNPRSEVLYERSWSAPCGVWRRGGQSPSGRRLQRLADTGAWGVQIVKLVGMSTGRSDRLGGWSRSMCRSSNPTTPNRGHIRASTNPRALHHQHRKARHHTTQQAIGATVISRARGNPSPTRPAGSRRCLPHGPGLRGRRTGRRCLRTIRGCWS